MEVKEHEPSTAAESEIVLCRNIPTRLHIMHDMLSSYMAKDVVSLVLIYYLDRVGLIVEWFDALRAGDIFAVHWFCANVTMTNEGLSDEKYEEAITVKAHEAFARRYEESYEKYTDAKHWDHSMIHERRNYANKELAALREKEKGFFVRDHFTMKSGWAHIRCELQDCGRVLAAAPLRTLLPIIAELNKRQIPIRRAMNKYIIAGYDDCMALLQGEMKDVAALVPPLCHVKGRFPYGEKPNMLTKDRESFALDNYSEVLIDQDILRCEIYRQAPPKLRLQQADHYRCYEQSEKTDDVLIIGEASWKGEAAIGELSRVYHTGLYCQAKIQALRLLRGVVHKGHNGGREGCHYRPMRKRTNMRDRRHRQWRRRKLKERGIENE